MKNLARYTFVSVVPDHTHSEPFHVYSDLTEVTVVKAKITIDILNNSLFDFIVEEETRQNLIKLFSSTYEMISVGHFLS